MNGIIAAVLAISSFFGMAWDYVHPSQNVGLAVLTAPQGGTGIGTVTAGDVGKVLTVSNNSPFTYNLTTPSGGSGSASTDKWATSTDSVSIKPNVGQGIIVNSASSTINGLNVSNGTTTNATSTNLDVSNQLTVGTLSGFLKAVVGKVTTAAISLTADVTGTLPVANGGTGQASFTASQLIYGNGTNALSSVATSSVTNGTGISFTGTPGALVGGTSLTITNTGVTSLAAANGITVSASTGAVTIGNQNQISTSSLSVSGVLYPTGTSPTVVTTAATSSIASGTGITVTNGTTAYVIGSQPTITNTGLISASCTGFATCSGTNPLSVIGLSSSKWATSTDTFGIYPNGLANPIVGIGTTTPKYTLSVASSTRAQLALSDGSLTSDQWVFRSINSNLYISSSTASTFSTSTIPAFTIAQNGNIGIGLVNPGAMLTVSRQGTAQLPISDSAAQFVGLDGNPLRLTFDTHNNANTSGTALMFRRSRGTAAAPSAVQQDDVLGSLNFRGYGVTGYAAGSTGLINSKAEGTFTDTSMPTALTFDTTPTTSVTATEKMRLTGSGLLGIGTTTPQWTLTVASSTGPQLALLDTSLTQNPYTLRAINGNFYLATSSPSTFATSTVPALSFDINGVPTFGQLPGSGTTCAQLTAAGALQRAASACGSSSVSTDKWATSTLPVLAIYPNSALYVGIGTTTPRWPLQLSTSTTQQLSLTDGGAATNGWSLRTVNNNFYLATTSPTTFGTSTVNALSFDVNGVPSFGQLASNGYVKTSGGTGALTVQVAPIPIADGGTNATACANTNGVWYWDGTRYVCNVNTTANTLLVGSNAAPVFSASPTLGTSLTVPLVIGGSAVGSSLEERATSGAGVGAEFIKWTLGNNGAIEAARLQENGLGIGTTSPRWAVTIASSTRPQLALADGSLTQTPWTLRSVNGNLYFATSSVTTFATSTLPSLTLDQNQNVDVMGGNLQVGTTSNSQGKLLYVVGNQSGGIATFSRNADGVAASLLGTQIIELAGLTTDVDNSGPAQTFNYRPANSLTTNVLASIGAYRNGANNTGILAFNALTAGSSQEIMRLANNTFGAVGIGTTTPRAVVQINSFAGASKVPQLVISDSSQGTDQKNWFASTTPASGNSAGNLALGVMSDSYALTTLFTLGRSGRLGIGTTTPAYPLMIASSTAPQIGLSDGSLTSNQWIFRNEGGTLAISTSSPSTFATSTPSAIEITSQTTTVLGVGTSSPWKSISFVGTGAWSGLDAAAAGTVPVCINTNNQLFLGSLSTNCVPSSERFKKDIHDYNGGLETLSKLRPVTFYFKTGDAQQNIGGIAEAVQKVDPRLVEVKDGKVMGIRLDNLDWVLVSAVQELQKEIQNGVVPAKRSVEENWQWICIGLLAIWNLYLQFRKKKA